MRLQNIGTVEKEEGEKFQPMKLDTDIDTTPHEYERHTKV